MAVEVEGLDDLNRQLRKLAKESPRAVERAAFAGGLKIQGYAQDNVPVERGNLRASAYTQRSSGGLVRGSASGLDPSKNFPDPAATPPLTVEVGFSAKYAIYVHENMEQTLKGEPRPSGLGTYWNPGGPKFLERAVNENGDEIVDIVEAYLEKAFNQ